jgi:gas vesicle protein
MALCRSAQASFLSSRKVLVMGVKHDMNNASTSEHRNHGFVIGMLAGTFVGAGLALWLAPRTAGELRQRMSDSAARLGKRASDKYQQASAGVGETVAELTRKGRGARDNVADVVARGAHEVERYAASVKSASPVVAE